MEAGWGCTRAATCPSSLSSPAICKPVENELVLAVWDPTDTHWQARGKQVLNPRSIWYTAVSGIWQTVWLEAVPADLHRRIEDHP